LDTDDTFSHIFAAPGEYPYICTIHPYMAGSHIVPVMVGNPQRCKAISDELLLRFGIYVQPINYPTVPRGTERLRLTPTPLHSDEQIDRLVTALAEIWSNSPVGSRRAGRSPASHEREIDRRR
ncbi:MAG TPA: aminotransferase class I/II-fold pyridoxal phosphate-dependent enzyme, partial [Stellaceae bacterium]|nr:aminotransferase class I/II-fold pyridoxal phosphate-dependent enzyme [Stellaceae bacterium]